MELKIVDTKPKLKAVEDVKSSFGVVLDTKSKNLKPMGEEVAYLESRTLLASMPIPFGGAFHLTYPTAITVQAVRS